MSYKGLGYFFSAFTPGCSAGNKSMRFTKSSNDFWLKMPWIIAEQSHYQEMLILMSQSVDEGNIYLSLILLNENLYCFCLLTVNYFFDFVIVGEY